LQTLPSLFPRALRLPPAPSALLLHERDGLLHIRDRIRHRGRLLREPAVQLEPLRREDPKRLAAL